MPAPAAQAPLLECDAAHKAALQNAEERVMVVADKLWGRINGELVEQRRKLLEADDWRARGEAVVSLFDWTCLGLVRPLPPPERLGLNGVPATTCRNSLAWLRPWGSPSVTLRSRRIATSRAVLVVARGGCCAEGPGTGGEEV